jgi:hypothetical protein
MSKKDSEVNIEEKIGIHASVDAELIKVSTTKKDGSIQNFEFPTTFSSKDIAITSAGTSTTIIPPEQMQQLVETIDYAKTNKPFISEIEISLSFKDGLKFRIKREPSKVIKSSKKV